MRIEENLKCKLWNFIFEILFLDYIGTGITFCYEFNLKNIASYKRTGFADYASVIFSGKNRTDMNAIFLGEVASTSPNQTEMHKDWMKLAVELSAALFSLAGKFRNSKEILNKLRVYGALIGGTSIELCMAYLHFNIEEGRYSVIFHSSSKFLKFDLFDPGSISDKIIDNDCSNYLTEKIDKKQVQEIEIGSDFFKTDETFESEFVDEDFELEGFTDESYSNDFYQKLAKVSDMPFTQIRNEMEGLEDIDEEEEWKNVLNSELFSDKNLSQQSMVIMRNFVECIVNYGIWLRTILQQKDDNDELSDSDDDDDDDDSEDEPFELPVVYSLLPKIDSRSGHGSRSPPQKRTKRQKIIASVPQSSPVREIKITKRYNLIEKCFYTGASFFLSAFKPRTFSFSVPENSDKNDDMNHNNNYNNNTDNIDTDNRKIIYHMEYLMNGLQYISDMDFQSEKYEALKFLLNGFCALHYIHKLGFVHADISSNNVRFSMIDNIWKIIDFDQTMGIESSATLIRYGGTKGFTGCHYDEQVGGIFTFKSDILSLILVFKYFWPELNRNCTIFTNSKFDKLINQSGIIPIIKNLLKKFSLLQRKLKLNDNIDRTTVQEALTIVSSDKSQITEADKENANIN